MSIYFDNLLTRVLQPSADVRPRLPARFESISEPSAMTSKEAIVNTSARDQIASTPRQPATESAPSPAAPMTSIQLQDLRPTPKPDRPTELSAVVEPLMREVIEERIVFSGAPQIEPRQSAPLREIERWTAPRPEDESVPSYATMAPEVPPPSKPHERPLADDGAVTNHEESSFLARLAPDATQFQAPAPLPLPEANGSVSPSITVRVHIGRIQVQAPPAPRPAMPSRPPSARLRPAQSLDEYLGRRGR